MTIFGSFGIRRLIDQQMRFLAPGSKAWLRVKNFNSVGQNYAEMGFAFTPSATGATQPVGYIDIPITPPPVVRMVSMHNMAMALQAGIALREGARIVMISHTFVEAQQTAKGYSNPRQVFEDASVIGIVTEGLIVSIESIYPDYSYGTYITWHLTGNSNELQ